MRLLIILLVFLSYAQAKADYVKVTRDAVIREDSLSSAAVIEQVVAGTLMPLLSDRLFGTGYLKVKTPSGKVGYIYKYRVRVESGAISPSTAHPPGALPGGALPSGGNLELHMINVGQGDAMIIRCPDGMHEILIDAAELNSGIRYSGSQTEFRNYLSSYQSSDNPIEVVVATHPHSDHIAGMSWIIDKYNVGLYVDNGMSNPSGTFKSLEKKLVDRNIHRARLNGTEIPDVDFCPRPDVRAQILRPNGYDQPGIDPNNYSVVLRIDYGSTSFLFTGDVEKEMEEYLINDPATNGWLDVDFLKVGHHGSHSSSTKDFLDVVTPNIAAISCGAEIVGTNKSHKHPRMVTINNLLPYLKNRNGMETTLEGYNKAGEKWEQLSSKAALYITNNDGDLIFLSDGDDIWRKGDK